jgi:Domain of unknown function (DUF4360)
MRKALYVSCATLVMAATAFLSAPARAAEAGLGDPAPAPEGEVPITLTSVSGSGCPSGTQASTLEMAPDKGSFTIRYPSQDYKAMVGVGATALSGRKNCQVSVDVDVPAGYTFGVVSLRYEGVADIAPGAVATDRTNAYFKGSTQTASVSHTFSGSPDGALRWTASDEFPIASRVWSPCGALSNLNVNSELRIMAGSSNTKKTTSYIAMGSPEDTSTAVLNVEIAWAAC